MEQREAIIYQAARYALIALLAGLLLALLIVPARASDCGLRIADCGLKDERLEKLMVLASFAAIDYNQSVDLFFNRTGYYEINPILGKHPSRRDMLVFGAAGMGLLWGAAELLERAGYPRAAQVLVDSALSSEQLNIEDNALVADGRQRRIDAVPVMLTWRW